MARTIDLRHDIIKAANDKVRVSSNDTTSDFLDAKIVAGTGIVINELNDGGNEQFEITAPNSTTDEKVKVSSNDTTEGYLEDKIVGKSGKIVVTTLNDGADEDTEINIGADVFDKTTDDTDDITEGANKFVTASDLTNLGNLSGTNTGDVTVTDTAEIDLTLTGQDIKADLKTTGVVAGAYPNANVTVDDKGRVTAISSAAGDATLVSTVTGISMTAIADHLIYTVPAGKQFVAQRIIVRLTAISGAGSLPKVSVGSNAAAYDNIYGNNSLSGLSNTLDGFAVSVEGTFRIVQSGVGIYLRVNNVATYTTYVTSVDLIGFLT